MHSNQNGNNEFSQFIRNNQLMNWLSLNKLFYCLFDNQNNKKITSNQVKILETIKECFWIDDVHMLNIAITQRFLRCFVIEFWIWFDFPLDSKMLLINSSTSSLTMYQDKYYTQIFMEQKQCLARQQNFYKLWYIWRRWKILLHGSFYPLNCILLRASHTPTTNI